MFIRRPRIASNSSASGIQLLKDALAQYHVSISPMELTRELQTLNIDDIDFIEAIELVERAVGARVKRERIRPSTTVGQIAQMIDKSRRIT